MAPLHAMAHDPAPVNDDGLYLSPVERIDLRHLAHSDIQPLLTLIHSFLRKHDYAGFRNLYVKPEALAARWGLSVSCLNQWRASGAGPVYFKTGPSQTAQVRYPMLGENGVLDFESKRQFQSIKAERHASLENM